MGFSNRLLISCSIAEPNGVAQKLRPLAQLAEQWTFNPLVAGSSPARPTTAHPPLSSGNVNPLSGSLLNYHKNPVTPCILPRCSIQDASLRRGKISRWSSDELPTHRTERRGDSTTLKTLDAVQAFYRFICKRHSLPNPIELVDAPIRHKKVRPTLSTNELSELCIQPKTLRDTALITLLIDNGVRSGEAVSLKRQNIFDDHIKVDGKTGEREVPISQETRDLLLALVEANRPDSDYVFQGKRGPITVSGVYQIIHPYMLAAGINGPKLGPHRIRHAFGKHYIKNGGDTRSLQKIMGHANITTTEIYVDLSTDDIVEKHRQFTPLRTAHYSTRALREAEDIIRLRRQNE